MNLYFCQISAKLNKSNRPVGLPMQVLSEVMTIYGYQIPIVCDEYSDLKAISLSEHERLGEIQFFAAPFTFNTGVPYDRLGVKSGIDVQCDVLWIVPIHKVDYETGLRLDVNIAVTLVVRVTTNILF